MNQLGEEGEEIIVRIRYGPSVGLYCVRIEHGINIAYAVYPTYPGEDDCYAEPDFSRRIGYFDGQLILPIESLQSTRPTKTR